MTKEIGEIFSSGLENKEFLEDYLKADGDEKPSQDTEEIQKHFFAAIYYGWLVGKHGEKWKENL